MTAFRDGPIDRRRLNMRDRRDLNVSGNYGDEARAQSYLKAYKGNLDYQAKRPIRTTSQTPGSGGLSPGVQPGTPGVGIQQQRLREVGDANRRQEAFRPDFKDTVYDIYS